MRQYFIFIFLFSISWYGFCGNKTKRLTRDTTVQQQIPILAWFSIPEAFTNPERFRELAETGINLHFSYYSSAGAAQKALDLAENSI